MWELIARDPAIQELVREWEDQGRTKEARSMLHAVLAARSLATTPDVRARINVERDLVQLRSWLEAAATAHAISDVFPAGSSHVWETILQDPTVQKLLRERAANRYAAGYAEGCIEQTRSSLHIVLSARSFSLASAVRGRIESEQDLARLRSWLVAAATAGTIDDVFRDG